MAMQRPLVWVAAAFAAGTAFGLRWAPPLAALFALLVLLWLAACRGIIRRHRSAGALLLVGFGLSGALWAGIWAAGNQSQLFDNLNTYLDLTGTVADYPQIYANRVVYTLRAEELEQGEWSKAVDEDVQVTIFSDGSAGTVAAYRYGDVLKIHGLLSKPPAARNPGEFDYRAFLWRRGIHAQMAVGPEAAEKLGEETPNRLYQVAYSAKDRVVQVLHENLDPREAGVLQALLFGDKERLDDQLKAVFSSLGIMHALAVSGLHVGFVLALILALAGALKIGPRATAALAMAAIFFYALVTGFSPPVVRASLMTGLGLLAPLVNRRADSYTSLAIAALALLLVNPSWIFDSGFQFSFIATLGILYLGPLLPEIWPSLPLSGALAVPLAAQAATMPLSAAYFNLLPLLALSINVLAVPVIGVIVIIGLMVFIMAQLIPVLAVPLAVSAGELLKALLAVLELISRFPGVALSVPTPAPWMTALFFGGLILLREGYRHRQDEWYPLAAKRLKMVALVSTAALLVVNLWPAGELKTVFLDVGQGDAIFLVTPGGHTVLVDGGGYAGERSMGELVIVPYLQREGIRRLDLVVSTHPDSDHLGGLKDVVESVETGLVVLPKLAELKETASAYGPFGETLQTRRIPYQTVSRGDRILLEEGIELLVLNPGNRPTGEDNDNSIVLKITYGTTSYLLTGDIEEKAMEEILSSGMDIKAQVFKFPHHGSRGSLEPQFLEQVNPELVVIPVGVGNNFGHPAPEVLDFFQRQGAPVYRTDLLGAITVWSNGRELRIETMLPFAGSELTSPRG